MSETKRTPGPWKFKTDPFTGDCGIHAEGTGIFVEAFADIRHEGEANKAEALANAQLIAAAPELLDALKAMDVALCDGFVSQATRLAGRKALIAARAAIAKAEGRS